MVLTNSILTHFFSIIYCRGKVLEFKTRDRGFAPRQPFPFFRRRRRRRFYNYQSYLGFASSQSLSSSHVDVGDAFQFINGRPTGPTFKTIGRGFASRHCFLFFRMCRGKSYAAAKSRTRRLGLEKKKRWQGANPRPIDLKASALPLHHSNLWFIVSYLMISALKFKRLTSTPLRPVGPSLRYIIYKMGKVPEIKSRDPRFDSRQPFLFF